MRTIYTIHLAVSTLYIGNSSRRRQRCMSFKNLRHNKKKSCNSHFSYEIFSRQKSLNEKKTFITCIECECEILFRIIFMMMKTQPGSLCLSNTFTEQRKTNKKIINNLPCSYGENVPASMLMYGSILIEVTSIPQQLSNVPNELAITPLPTPLITPPVTKIYFIFCVIKRLHISLDDARFLFLLVNLF